MNWYLKVLKQYTDFNGRARRKEYWMFTLFNIIFAIALSIIRPASVLYGVVLFLPTLAVTVRRLHDAGKSGVWVLIGLIPAIGTVWLILLLALDSEPRANQYGLNPKS